MSYKVVKEPNNVEAIVIRGWEQGIAQDPYSGIGRMLNVDLSTPGEVAVGFPITASTQSGGALTIPIHDAISYVAGMANAYFILDDTSQVFKSTSITGTWAFLSTSNVTTGASAINQGLAYWKGYLFKFRATHIDYLTGGTGTWVSNWNPANGSTTSSDVIQNINHYAIVSQDDALYFCNGAGIGSILEVAGKTFDPADTTTYTFNAGTTNASNALRLPTYDTAQSIAEQGVSLLIGGSLNAIYPWDRTSPSFGYPIFIGDIFIKRMVTVNTNVYIFPGFQTGRGRIYVTNSTQANLFFKIPDYIFGEQDPYYIWGDAIFHRNNLIFGFLVAKNSATQTTIGNGTGLITSSGVWAIDLETQAFREISDMNTSSGHGNASALITPTGSTPGMGYIVAWDNVASTSGIGYSGTTAGTGGSSYNVTTDLIPVGTLFERKTFSQVEFKLRTALESGESIQIIAGVDGSFSTIGTTNTVGAISDVYTVNFEKAQWLQFQVVGVGNSATSGCRLEEIRIR